MRTDGRRSLWVFACAAVLATGCGSSSPLPALLINGTDEPTDAGSPAEPGLPDASLPADAWAPPPSGFDAAGDSSPQASGDSSPPPFDATPAPGNDAGVFLPGTDIFPLSVTTDEDVVFGQLLPGGGVGPALFAVPLAGGAPTQINSQSSYYFVDVESRDVFSWEQSAATATVGKLSLWSRTRAIPLAATSVVGLTSASADGSELAFTENVTATQLDVALLAGDAGSRVVLSGVSEAACSTRWAFARSTLVVQHCDAPVPDGGAPGGQPATLSAFNGGGTRVDLATLAPVPPASRVGWGAWDVAPDGSFLYASVNGASPTATLIAVPSGAKTLVDSEGEEGFVTADGAAVVYRSGKALHRAATGAPSPIVLATAGNATGLLGWSLDGGAVAYFDQWTKDVDGNLLTDLAVSTTAASGSVARQIVTGATTFFLGFTADASHVLYTSAIDLSTGLYTLAASPVAGGSAPRVLGADVLQFWSGSGSKVLFADNCNKSAQVCDVHAVDLATGAAPALIASPANASLANAFAVTPDATEVVFATNVGAPGSFGVPGLYVIPVP